MRQVIDSFDNVLKRVSVKYVDKEIFICLQRAFQLYKIDNLWYNVLSVFVEIDDTFKEVSAMKDPAVPMIQCPKCKGTKRCGVCGGHPPNYCPRCKTLEGGCIFCKETGQVPA